MRYLYLGAGFTLVGLGIIGAFLPVMPSTIFFILALPCFTKSCPAMEDWLLNHPRFGESLRAWKADKAISRKHKMIAISMLCLSIGLTTIFLVRIAWVQWLLVLTAVSVASFIATRKSAVSQDKSATI